MNNVQIDSATKSAQETSNSGGSESVTPAPVVVRTLSRVGVDIAGLAAAIGRAYAERPTLQKPTGRAHRV